MKIDSILNRTVYFALLVFLVALTFSTALTEISLAVALVAWLILKRRQSLPFPFEGKMFAALSAFVLLCVLSFFWSEFPTQSFRGVLKTLKQFFLFWMVAETLADSQRHQAAVKVLVFTFIFLGLDGAWQYVFGSDLLRGFPYEAASSGPRISASFHNYGLLAAFLITFFPILVSRLEAPARARNQFLIALGILFGVLLLFWTRLRGAWIAFGIGSLFNLWIKKRRRTFAFIILAGAFGFFLLPRSMVIHLDLYGKEQSLVERFYLWDRAVDVIRARPLTGTGINTYAVAHQKYDRRRSWRVQNYYSHNGYLQMAAETGIPSLVCFLAFLFFYFKNAMQRLRVEPQSMENRVLVDFLTGMLNFLILGLIDTGFHNPPSILGFWFLAGWGIACQNRLRQAACEGTTKREEESL